MIVIDEYLAVRSLLGHVPDAMPDGPRALPASAHWRLLQRLHSPGSGQLSRVLGQLSPEGLAVLRRPNVGQRLRLIADDLGIEIHVAN